MHTRAASQPALLALLAHPNGPKGVARYKSSLLRALIGSSGRLGPVSVALAVFGKRLARFAGRPIHIGYVYRPDYGWRGTPPLRAFAASDGKSTCERPPGYGRCRAGPSKPPTPMVVTSQSDGVGAAGGVVPKMLHLEAIWNGEQAPYILSKGKDRHTTSGGQSSSPNSHLEQFRRHLRP